MTKIEFAIPDELSLALGGDAGELASSLRMAAAVKLYELGRLSSGAASELAGVPKPVFLSGLASFGVDTFRMTEAELRQDQENA